MMVKWSAPRPEAHSLVTQVERLKLKLGAAESDKEQSRLAVDRLAEMMNDAPPDSSACGWGSTVKDAAVYFKGQIEAAAHATPRRLRLPTRSGLATPVAGPTPSRTAVVQQQPASKATPSRLVLGSMVKPTLEAMAHATLSPQQKQALMLLAQSAVLPVSPARSVVSPASLVSPRGARGSPRGTPRPQVLSPRSPLSVLPASEARRRGCRITNGGGSSENATPVKGTPARASEEERENVNEAAAAKGTPGKMSIAER